MSKAALSVIPETTVFGQSIGCVLSLPGHMNVHELLKLATKIKSDRPEYRVTTLLTSARKDIGVVCLSISFHLPSKQAPQTRVEMLRRTELLKDWIKSLGLGIDEFVVIPFTARRDFCDYMRTPMEVF